MSYNNIGLLYTELGDYPKSLEYFQRLLEIRKQLYGETNPNIAAVYGNISELYSKLGNEDKAEEYRQKALEIRQRLD